MKKKQKSVKLNMIMNMLLTMSNFIFPIITFPYISRILLPIGTGKVTFATSVVTYFGMFVQLGVPTYGVRACAKVRDDKETLSRIVHELLSINLLMTVVVYIVYIISLFQVPRFNQDLKLFFILGISIFLNAIGVEWLYKGLEEYGYITVRSIVFKLIAIIAMFLLVHEQKDYILYGGISIFASSASNILNFINLRKFIYLKSVGNYNVKKHIKYVLIFFAMSVATTIYTNLDNVMLGFMRDDVQVGYYGAAVKIKTILLSIVTSASTVLLPRASYYVDRGEMDEFYRILKKTMHFIVLVAFPFSVYFIFFAKEGILFLSGKEYGGAIMPMQVIMPTLLLIGITNVIGIQMMVPMGREKLVLYSEIAGAVTDLILNAIFIPEFGATGAAIGTLIAEIVVLTWQILSIKDIRLKIFDEVPWIKLILSVCLASAASVWIKNVDCNLFVALTVSAVCFFGIYGILLLALRDNIMKEIIDSIITKIFKK
ncbi:MAG: flippase [Lachnospiraceae bacterium]|nr:flippase [Lachnospiraceae bacterium]